MASVYHLARVGDRSAGAGTGTYWRQLPDGVEPGLGKVCLRPCIAWFLVPGRILPRRLSVHLWFPYVAGRIFVLGYVAAVADWIRRNSIVGKHHDAAGDGWYRHFDCIRSTGLGRVALAGVVAGSFRGYVFLVPDVCADGAL